jgi:hypothetical protein
MFYCGLFKTAQVDKTDIIFIIVYTGPSTSSSASSNLAPGPGSPTTPPQGLLYGSSSGALLTGASIGNITGGSFDPASPGPSSPGPGSRKSSNDDTVSNVATTGVGGASCVDPDERQKLRQREALWDLFQSECTFLYDHLMVLKNVKRIFKIYKGLQNYSFANFLIPGVHGAIETHPGRRICHVCRARVVVWKFG